MQDWLKSPVGLATHQKLAMTSNSLEMEIDGKIVGDRGITSLLKLSKLS
jgi:hypothetical protein